MKYERPELVDLCARDGKATGATACDFGSGANACHDGLGATATCDLGASPLK